MVDTYNSRWELADNYESSVTSIITMYQIIHGALISNLGSKYRSGGWSNVNFVAIYSICFCLITSVLLLDPNSIGCMFRINCGTGDALQNLGYKIPLSAPTQYFSNSDHNVLPMYFRWGLFAISLVNLLLFVLWEKVVVLGSVRAWAIRQFSNKEFFRL
jgi:hypothetical protein